MTAIILSTSRPRGGRFEPIAERELHEPARSAASQLPGAHGRGLVIIEELAGPQGIPDLTAIIGDPRPLRMRLASDIPPLLNEIDAGIVAACHPRVTRSITYIAQRLGWPEASIKRRLPGLVRMKALTERRPNRYVAAPELSTIGRIYAIETKVRDGGSAIRQVRSYTTWADAYVIVTGPLGPAASTRLSNEVAKDRGGLVVDGQWLQRPTIRLASPARRLWSAEHVVAAMRPRSPKH